MSPQEIALYISSLGFGVVLSVIIGINLSRLRGLNPQNFHERADEMAATTLTSEIADLLESLLSASHVVNFKFSSECRSAVALVDKLVGGSQSS